MRKFLLFMLMIMVSLPLLAQNGGVKGVVVNRVDKSPLAGTKITFIGTDIPALVTKTGAFEVNDIAPGTYQLRFEATEFLPVTVTVKVGNQVVNIYNISLSPEAVAAVEEDDFTEFDTETADDNQSLPVVLSASNDIFDNISGYKFSAMRFKARGYDGENQSVYLNGIYLNDALSGYSPYSLWTGLNEATRNKELTGGLMTSDYGVGGIGGTTNINTRPSQLRKGFRASIVNANNNYRFRVMLTYASGESDNGWSYALSASTRQGGNDYIYGVYYNAFAYYLGIEKKFNPFHRLAFTFLGTPTERGAQTATTQEVYDLIGNNYYNANWGYQNGDKRNARVRNNHEPVAMLNYYYTPKDDFNLTLSVAYRFGKNGYSALDWYDAQDPRPDYYRNLPSYYVSSDASKDNPYLAAWLTEAWYSDRNTRHIYWDRIYNVNYNSLLDTDLEYWGNPSIATGSRRSKYILEERRTDQRDFNAKLQIMKRISDHQVLNLGVDFRRNTTEYYKKIKDLLGGDYWLDIDQFAERDFGSVESSQNNLNTPNRLVKKGDKYGYDYYAHVQSEKIWATYKFNKGSFEGYLAGETGITRFWREGKYRKGLFPNNSFGDSERKDFWTYTTKAGLTYKITGNQRIYANIAYMEQAPYFKNAFVSPRTRNSLVPNLTTEKVFSTDFNYALRINNFKMRLTGFYTTIKDRTNLISFYDDQYRAYTNFAMSGIEQTHVGMELGINVPLVWGVDLRGALTIGDYYYSSNPKVIQTVDNSEKVIANTTVYWKDMKVHSTPQKAASIGLNYRGPHNIYAGIDLNYYADLYLSMNPLYRTDEALVNYNMFSEEERNYMIWTMRKQEKFDDAFVLNANFSKSWYIKRIYNLGFSLEVKNILNDQNIKTGGYEQMRLKKNELNDKTYYTRFDSKYFYMFGTTYYLNIYFRF